MQPQVGELGLVPLEHEVIGETLNIAIDLLIEALGRFSIERSQISIKQDAAATHDQDALRDVFNAERRGDEGISVLAFAAACARSGRHDTAITKPPRMAGAPPPTLLEQCLMCGKVSASNCGP